MIIAVDPGKRTGWASWRPSVDEFRSGEDDFMPFLLQAAITLDNAPVEAVVCESFIITNATLTKSRGENWSLESIGALRFLCTQHEVPFVLQTPARAKSFSTDEKLKRIGWHTAGKGHATDASRHLLLYAVSNGLLELGRLRA